MTSFFSACSVAMYYCCCFCCGERTKKKKIAGYVKRLSKLEMGEPQSENDEKHAKKEKSNKSNNN